MRETNGAKVRRGIEYKRESSDPGQVNIWFVCAKVRSSPLQGTLLVWSSKGWSKGERDNFILSLIPVSGFHPISSCLIPTITMDGANSGIFSLSTFRVSFEVRKQLFLFTL
jgi:hypothetical protein